MLISIFLEFDIFCNKKREKKSSLLSIKNLFDYSN
jgi:hypothetical protein